MRVRCAPPAEFLCCILATLVVVKADFHDREYVPAARRAQFHGVRTQFHDLLGRHCPRFGEDALVAIPIPRSKGYLVTDNYKIQFSFDGDRLYTEWLRLTGKGAPDAPIVHVNLVRSGPALLSVTAQVGPLPQEYLEYHRQLIDEFRNASAWPKHLLVQYKWTHQHAVDVFAGLYLVFISGLVITLVMVGSVVHAYHSKLAAFMSDLAAGDAGMQWPSQKAD